MRPTALALSTLLVGLTLTGEALAIPGYYNEVIKDLGAQGCPPSTKATVSGCTNLCHVGDPNAGAALPPVDPGPLYLLLTSEFGWSGYTSLNPATLDAPLAALKADSTYANVVQAIQAKCSSPEDALTADGFGVAQPVYGCAVGGVGRGTAGGAFAIAGLAVMASLTTRRRRGRATGRAGKPPSLKT